MSHFEKQNEDQTPNTEIDDAQLLDRADGLYSDASDEALLRSLRSGDSGAQDALIRRYTRVVRICARPFFLSGGDSEDLIQEGMLGLLSAIRTYDSGKSAFKTFAVLCIRRSIISAVRAAQNKNNTILSNSLSIDQIISEEGNSFPLAEQDPESLIIDRDERRRFADTIKSVLSDFEQHVLTLYLNGLSYREMASVLDRPMKSIDNAVQRIRRKYDAIRKED